MNYYTIKPSPKLAPFVRFFWVLEDDVKSGEPFVHRSTADGCVEIVFHYRARFDEIKATGEIDTSPLSSIQAQSARFRRFVTNESFGMFGAYIYPYALSRLFSSPATDFTDLMPDLESALGPAGRRLESRMLSASGSAERVRIMTHFLERKLDANNRDLPSISSAINTIIEARGIVNIRDLAREHSISARQFERKFKEFAGLSPKLYSRIIRFQATTEYRSARNKTLTEIAYDCGYYDQSHFINDFREFSGYTPKEYFRGEAEGTQYMAA